MLNDYAEIVKRSFTPTIRQYGLQFAQLDGDEMFLVGKGYALYVFIDRRDRRGDVWYISLDSEGIIRTHTLMYVFADRFTSIDRDAAGQPLPQLATDEYISATFRVANHGLLNHCHDILSGDSTWLRGYQDEKGDYSRHVARFLAPYFQKQGHYVKLLEE
jgi:hypothetical protein